MSDAPRKPPEPPRKLGVDGRRLWRSVVKEWELSDPELETLRVAAMAADRLAAAQEALSADGLVILNRFDAKVQHPAATIAEKASGTINASLKLLDLPEPPEEDAGSRAWRAKPGPRKRTGVVY